VTIASLDPSSVAAYAMAVLGPGLVFDPATLARVIFSALVIFAYRKSMFRLLSMLITACKLAKHVSTASGGVKRPDHPKKMEQKFTLEKLLAFIYVIRPLYTRIYAYIP